LYLSGFQLLYVQIRAEVWSQVEGRHPLQGGFDLLLQGAVPGKKDLRMPSIRHQIAGKPDRF
jgi:hypothetical protein